MPPAKPKGGKMMSLINYRLRVTLSDGRQLTGQMLAFDQHMNLVLADTEEFRRVKPKKGKRTGAGKKADEVDEEEEDEVKPTEQEMKRTIGLIILRGETIVSLSIEAPPPATDGKNKPSLAPGPGRGAPAGRGMGLAPPPGAAPPMMQGRPMPYARPPPGMPGMPGMPPGGPPPGMPFARPPGFGAPPGMPGGPPPGMPPFGGPPGGPGQQGYRPPPPGFPMRPPGQ